MYIYIYTGASVLYPTPKKNNYIFFERSPPLGFMLPSRAKMAHKTSLHTTREGQNYPKQGLKNQFKSSVLRQLFSLMEKCFPIALRQPIKHPKTPPQSAQILPTKDFKNN